MSYCRVADLIKDISLDSLLQLADDERIYTGRFDIDVDYAAGQLISHADVFYIANGDIPANPALPATNNQWQLADASNSPIMAVFDDAMADAQQEMDSYLSVRYAMPLDAVPQLKDCNSQLAIWRLMRRRQLGDTDDAKARRANMISWLKQVRDYKANVVGINDKTGDDSSSGMGAITVKPGISKNYNWESFS